MRLSVLHLLVRVFALLVGTLAPATVVAQAAAPAAAPESSHVFVARNLTRVEMWSFFTPPAGGGDPDYTHIGNRLFFGVEGRRPRFDYIVGLQYVQFGGLPDDAIGPGTLGTGGAYFQHAGRSDSRQLYLRAVNIRLKQVLPGLDVQVGRMGYTSGAEGASDVPKIEAVKRQRLDSRLVGEFEWSIYQRAYDGVRADWTRGAARFTGSALRPTQGGFEDAAGVGIDDLTVVNGAATFKPGKPIPGAEMQLFAHYYDDSRRVSGRPDNSGRPASRADVEVGTFGASVVGAYSVPAGQVDVLGWIAVQNGSWYDQSHRGWSVVLEGGYQWTEMPWQPWVRGGLLYASGDDRPGDERHGTFFQMLPTVRRYSMTTAYSQMNLNDRFAQLMARPNSRLTLRGDVHWLSLAEGADRWYFGSGATQEEGSIFGFAARPSGGDTGFGTAIEGSADYTVNRHFSVNGYVGHIRGGDVVRRSFTGESLTFGYLETQIRF
jgi:hypothetical protein